MDDVPYLQGWEQTRSANRVTLRYRTAALPVEVLYSLSNATAGYRLRPFRSLPVSPVSSKQRITETSAKGWTQDEGWMQGERQAQDEISVLSVFPS